LSDLKSDPRYPQVEEAFSKLSQSEKVRLLEEFDADKNLAVAFLAYKEAEKAFKESDKSKVEEYVEWIEKRYGSNAEMSNLLKGLGARSENDNVKVNLRTIGIVLPLSGDKKF